MSRIVIDWRKPLQGAMAPMNDFKLIEKMSTKSSYKFLVQNCYSKKQYLVDKHGYTSGVGSKICRNKKITTKEQSEKTNNDISKTLELILDDYCVMQDKLDQIINILKNNGHKLEVVK